MFVLLIMYWYWFDPMHPLLPPVVILVLAFSVYNMRNERRAYAARCAAVAP